MPATGGFPPRAASGAGPPPRGARDIGDERTTLIPDEIPPPLHEAACPRLAASRPEQPAAQVLRLAAGEFDGEDPVGSVEEMMSLVEDVTRRGMGIAFAAVPGLQQAERVVGNDNVGMVRPAHGPFDKALPEMIAGAVDALAATVREVHGLSVTEQFEKPAGQGTTLHVAVGGGLYPASDEAETNRVGERTSTAIDRVGEVEQAHIVLAPLAYHDTSPPGLTLGHEPVEFLVDLALQVPGVGADPHGATVPFRPQAGRCDVSKGLSHARARLRQHGADRTRLPARGEAGDQRLCIPDLFGPVLGIHSKK